MEPGIYENLPFEDYLKITDTDGIPAVSNSFLNKFRECPAVAKYYLDNGETFDSKDLLFGRALDTMVFERDKFKERFAVATKCAAKIGSGENKGKQCTYNGKVYDGKNWYCKTHGKHVKNEVTVDVISQDDYVRLAGCMSSIKKHAWGSRFFDGKGTPQLTIVWRDRNSGLLCKMRIDYYTHDSVILDLKKTRSASPALFSKSIYNYGYYRQGGIYTTGALISGLDVDHFRLVASEDKPPFITASYRVNEQRLADAHDEFEAMMESLARCYETGHWPSYDDENDEIDVPGWAGFEIEQAKSGKPVMSGVQPDDDLPF